MNYGGYIWNITNSDSIRKLLDASVGESFESDTFLLAKLKWQIVVFPNGWNEESKGVFHVCLKLLSFKSKWEELIICRSIQCLETKSSCTLITNYQKNGDTKSWKNGTLLLSELYQMKSIKTLTFQISIDVLKICLKNKLNQCSLYSSLSSQPRQTLDQQQHFAWTIEEDMLNKFRISYPCKSFESKRYKHRMWCLRAYPNGISQRDKGYVGLYLTLCKLPSHLSKIKVLYTLRCKEFKHLNHSRIKDFGYLDKSSWGVSRFFDCEKLYKLRSLTFFVDVTIMNEYDEDGNEIMAPVEGSRSYAQNDAFTPSKSETITMYHPDEEKVSALDLSRTMSSNLRLRHHGSLSNKSSLKQKQQQSIQQQDVQSMIQREVRKEIGELQNGYNMKLNSLCCIVEQIQINNDRLSSQTYEMMNTVNKICKSLQRERRTSSIEDKHILQLQHEMKSIKQIILQNNPRNVSRIRSHRTRSRQSSINESPIYFNDESEEDEMSEEVAMWLMNEVRLPQYIDNFIQNGFDDMDSVSDMSLAELDLIGISKLGHKKKLYRCIGELLEEDEEEEETQVTGSHEDPLQIIHDHNMFMRNTHKSLKSMSFKRQRHKSMEQYALNDGHLKVKKMRHPKRMSLHEMYAQIPLNERSYSSNL